MNATQTRKPRQRRSHERSVKVLVAPAVGNPQTFVRITQDGEAGYYWITPAPSDFGRAFRFEKPAPEVDVPRGWLRQSRRGLWYSIRDIPFGRRVRLIDFASAAEPCAA